MGAWSGHSAPIRSPDESGYEITNFSLEMAALNQELMAWEHTYNTIRPHPDASGPTSPHTNSSLTGNTKERRQSVTNLLDEYTHLTRAQ